MSSSIEGGVEAPQGGPKRVLSRVIVDGVELHLPPPVEPGPPWIGQHEVLDQLLAAWSCFSSDDLPLHPRLLGPPGVGKTSLAMAAAEALGVDVWVQQGTQDSRPEDLLVAPVIAPDGGIRYMASPLVAAMLCGGAVVLDEGNRMPEKSWASLAPLLDHRRWVHSQIAGVRLRASSSFRFVTTMNEDASTFELPEYIGSRLMPRIVLDFPERDEEAAILLQRLPAIDAEVLERTLDFLEAAHGLDLRYTVRDGLNGAAWAMKALDRGLFKQPGQAFERALELLVEPADQALFDPEPDPDPEPEVDFLTPIPTPEN